MTNTIVTPIPPFGPINQVTPFTYRDNDTFQTQLRGLRDKVNEQIAQLELIDASLRSDLGAEIVDLTNQLNMQLTTINDIVMSVTDYGLDARVTVTESDIATIESDTATLTTRIDGITADYRPAIIMIGVGIDPTGVTDSTVAIQAKLDSAGGGAAHFPRGVYRVSTTSDDTTGIERAALYLTSAHSGLSITGSGATIKAVNDGVNTWFNILKITDCAGLSVDGITFDANAQSMFPSEPSSAINGLACIYPKATIDRGCRDLTFTDCTFLNSFNSAFQTHGAYAQTGPFFYVSDVKIHHCHFEYTGAHGIALNYTKNVSVIGNTFYRLGRKPILSTGIGSGLFCDVSTANLNVVIVDNVGENPGYGFAKVEFHAGDTIVNKHILIADNKVTCTEAITGEAYTAVYGIRVNASNVVVRGNTIDGYRGRGIDMSGSQSESCTIVDNTLIMQASASSAYPAIDVSGNAGGHNILGNRLIGQKGVGININGITGMNVSDNRIIGSGATGMKVSGGSQVRVSNNTIQDSIGAGLYITSTSDYVTVDGNDIFDTRVAGARTQTIGLLVDVGSTNLEIRRNRIRNNISQQTNILGTLANEILDGGKVIYATAAPTTGAWIVGDTAINTVPVAGGYERWRCITSGIPGTWKGAGLIQA